MKRPNMLETMQQFRQWEAVPVAIADPISFTKVWESANRICDRYLIQRENEPKVAA